MEDLEIEGYFNMVHREKLAVLGFFMEFLDTSTKIAQWIDQARTASCQIFSSLLSTKHKANHQIYTTRGKDYALDEVFLNLPAKFLRVFLNFPAKFLRVFLSPIQAICSGAL